MIGNDPIRALLDAGPAAREPKRFLEGAHRANQPEALLDALSPDLASFGVTRVARLTGLDRIGIEVFGVARPNARGLSVAQGKGATAAAARLSGMMEAVELWAAERPGISARFAAAEELPDAAPGLWRLPAERALYWGEAVDLSSGTNAAVPFDLLHAVMLADRARDLPCSTNGLASGATLAEALCHGLAELIERHGVALLAAAPASARAARRLDLESVADPTAKRLVDRVVSAGCRLAVWDAGSEIAVPCFVAAIADAIDAEMPPGYGAGAHASAGVALVRAIAEAAQSRLTRISGARDDLEGPDFGPAATARAHWQSAGETEAGAGLAFGDLPDIATDCIVRDFHGLLAAMRAAGYDRVFAARLADDARFSVVRVLAPGLHGFWGVG